jgi:phage shock protein PspC (stress-responsive transcriptional regulator)
MEDSMNRPVLARSSRHRVLAGVCGGLAEWLGWDPTLVRLGYILLSILSVAFPGILVYIVLWLVMPDERDAQ